MVACTSEGAKGTILYFNLSKSNITDFYNLTQQIRTIEANEVTGADSLMAFLTHPNIHNTVELGNKELFGRPKIVP